MIYMIKYLILWLASVYYSAAYKYLQIIYKLIIRFQGENDLESIIKMNLDQAIYRMIKNQ